MMKTSEIVNLYNVLSEAKLTKLEDSDKYRIIKILRQLRSTAEDFETFKDDAQKRLRPENWDEVFAKLQQWRKEGEETTLTEDERKEVNLAIYTYESKVNECISEELNLEVDVAFPKISEQAFEKLLASNDWNAKLAMLIADEIVQEEE